MYHFRWGSAHRDQVRSGSVIYTSVLDRFSFSFFYKARQRLGDKLEFVDFDPVVGQKVLYREESKVRSIRDHQIERIPRLLYSNDVQSKWKSFADEP